MSVQKYSMLVLFNVASKTLSIWIVSTGEEKGPIEDIMGIPYTNDQEIHQLSLSMAYYSALNCIIHLVVYILMFYFRGYVKVVYIHQHQT